MAMAKARAQIEEKRRLAEERRKATNGEQEPVDDEAYARQVFEKYDYDGGGTIDAEELASLCYDMGFVMPDDEKDLVLSLLDSDRSGTIDADEFRAWFTVNKDEFFSGGYSDDVKSAIYYFKTYDKDLSGELDRPEFEAMCEGMGWGSDAVTETLAIMDRDGNGTVSLQEFLAWYTDDGMVTQLLQLYDADKSGGLNLKEFGDLCKRWKLKGKQVKNLFQKYDQDGNGELGAKDLKKMLERVQSKKASSRGAELPLRPAPFRTLVCVNQARFAPCCADLIAKGDTLCRGWLMVSEGKPPKKVGGQVQYGRAKKQFVTLVIDRGNSYTTSDHVEHEQLNFYNKAPQMSINSSTGASSPDLYYRGDEVQASVQETGGISSNVFFLATSGCGCKPGGELVESSTIPLRIEVCKIDTYNDQDCPDAAGWVQAIESAREMRVAMARRKNLQAQRDQRG